MLDEAAISVRRHTSTSQALDNYILSQRCINVNYVVILVVFSVFRGYKML